MSNTSDPIARVYASAMIELGRSQGTLGAIYDELHQVRRLYDEDAWFRSFFTSPRIDRDVKWEAVQKAFQGQVGRPILGLLRVLIDKGRESLLDNVVDQFDRFKDLAENRIHAYLTLAVEPAPDFLAAIETRLEKASGRDVRIHARIDPAVLGGASIRIGDKVIDRTLRTKLQALGKRLLTEQ